MKLARLVVAVAAAAVLAGCTVAPPPEASPTTDAAQECAQAAEDVAAAVRELVAGYSGEASLDQAPSASTASPTPTPDDDTDANSPDEALAQAVEAARDTRERLGCDGDDFESDLETGLSAIEPEGPIADAVLRRISATLLGDLRQDADEWVISADDDLRDVLARAAEGSTVVLPEGDLDVDETLVVLTGITLRGAGRDATSLRSHASDAALIIATAGLVRLEALSIDLTGGQAASGVVAGPSAAVALTDVRVAGATATADAVGGAGVYLSARANEASGRGTTLEVTDSLFESNAWAGIAVAGGHRVSIETTTFHANAGAGVLFLDASSGSVDASTFTGNAVGLAAAGSSTPTVVESTFSGGSVGVQADESAMPVIEGIDASGMTSAAVIFGGSSGGSISGTTCGNVPHGIVVADTAAPTLGENSCSVARGG